MITEAEIMEMYDAVKGYVLHEKYDLAIDQVMQVYQNHVHDKSQNEQLNALEDFKNILREFLGYTGRAAAQVGLRAGGVLNWSRSGSAKPSEILKHDQLATLLTLGKAIFDGKGNAAMLLQALSAEFNRKQAKNPETNQDTEELSRHSLRLPQ